MLKELAEFMAKGLVDQPDEVQVTQTEAEQGVNLELRVAKEDLGKVIGRQGRTARAFRTILGAAASKERKRVYFEIAE